MQPDHRHLCVAPRWASSVLLVVPALAWASTVQASARFDNRSPTTSTSVAARSTQPSPSLVARSNVSPSNAPALLKAPSRGVVASPEPSHEPLPHWQRLHDPRLRDTIRQVAVERDALQARESQEWLNGNVPSGASAPSDVAPSAPVSARTVARPHAQVVVGLRQTLNASPSSSTPGFSSNRASTSSVSPGTSWWSRWFHKP